MPVGPSAVAAAGEIYTHSGMKPFPVPRALTQDEITATIADFASAARNANRRTDGWGGSVAGRIRFAVETARAVVAEIGTDKVGIRLSPGNPLHDIVEDDLESIYGALVEDLASLDLVYIHLMETGARDLTRTLRAQWPGAFILNPATRPAPTGPGELALVAEGTTDLITYGALFLANPDLPARLAQAGPFNDANPAQFFGGDDHGYIDYPALVGAGA